MAGSAEDTVQEEALRRFDSIFRCLHRKALGHFGHLRRKSWDILHNCFKGSALLKRFIHLK